ncbi:hypothetical protein M427DRAFT_447065 [Gonapodya prolifera JEL478]|uniref:Uncharacterized protein n=1 Tax=Gonapodya prolifera (strain JEL478) TaxID=1344416 RepID=A0A139A378_GONPJ|nr:hypothetical protein M427DRAFT_447065 [Gonapodya prolifera JEL478]|eukprot:KXS11088.1 hypothetical protein M427DRAFT_447065 [Gonapodya prolifera JEL478]
MSGARCIAIDETSREARRLFAEARAKERDIEREVKADDVGSEPSRGEPAKEPEMKRRMIIEEVEGDEEEVGQEESSNEIAVEEASTAPIDLSDENPEAVGIVKDVVEEGGTPVDVPAAELLKEETLHGLPLANKGTADSPPPVKEAWPEQPNETAAVPQEHTKSEIADSRSSTAVAPAAAKEQVELNDDALQIESPGFDFPEPLVAPESLGPDQAWNESEMLAALCGMDMVEVEGTHQDVKNAAADALDLPGPGDVIDISESSKGPVQSEGKSVTINFREALENVSWNEERVRCSSETLSETPETDQIASNDQEEQKEQNVSDLTEQGQTVSQNVEELEVAPMITPSQPLRQNNPASEPTMNTSNEQEIYRAEKTIPPSTHSESLPAAVETPSVHWKESKVEPTSSSNATPPGPVRFPPPTSSFNLEAAYKLCTRCTPPRGLEWLLYLESAIRTAPKPGAAAKMMERGRRPDELFAGVVKAAANAMRDEGDTSEIARTIFKILEELSTLKRIKLLTTFLGEKEAADLAFVFAELENAASMSASNEDGPAFTADDVGKLKKAFM